VVEVLSGAGVAHPPSVGRQCEPQGAAEHWFTQFCLPNSYPLNDLSATEEEEEQHANDRCGHDKQGLPKPYVDSRPFRIEEVELEPPGEGEAPVEVRAAGLCHSDLSQVEGLRKRVLPAAAWLRPPSSATPQRASSHAG
jgi:hypothetical protein